MEENKKKTKNELLGRHGEPDINASPVSDDTDYLISGDTGGVFAESVSEITAEELSSDTPRRGRDFGRFMGSLFDKLVYLAAIGVFVYCIANLVLLNLEELEGAEYYDEHEFVIDFGASENGSTVMAQSGSAEAFVAGVSQPDSGIKVEASEYNEEIELIKTKLADLQNQYPDVYGYIMIEDTRISYPLVQGDDNEFYLNHGFTGETMKVGSIYVDYRNKAYAPSNYNLVLYGHNFTNGEMFGDLMKFVRSEEFFNTHKIYVYTMTGLYVYEPFNMSVFKYDFQYFRTYFGSGAAFVDFVNEMQSYSQFSKRIEVDEDDRIITLSTCTKLGISTLRYCLQGVLVEVVE